MIQKSEKPYRTVKEKLPRGGIVLIMSTTSLKRELINLKGMQKNNDKLLHHPRIRKTLQDCERRAFYGGTNRT